jgi:hypothetical protein
MKYLAASFRVGIEGLNPKRKVDTALKEQGNVCFHNLFLQYFLFDASVMGR